MIVVLAGAPQSAAAITLPPDFQTDTLVTGLAAPTDIQFAPDGRLFIGDGSRVRMRKPDGTVSTVIQINGFIHSLTLDSSFESNGYVFVFYYKNTTARLGRFQLNPDGTHVNPASPETVLLGSQFFLGTCPAPSNTVDCIPQPVDTHNIAGIVSAPDGTLFVANADNAGWATVDARAFNTYNEESFSGKILHIDREGRGLPGHPFCPTDDDLTHVCTKVHASGFRNPWRMSLRPSGNLVVGDVGWTTKEEVSLVTAPGMNFGWPCYEGTIRTPGYKDDSRCAPIYAQEGTPAGAVGPIHDYPHASGQGSVTMGSTYASGPYPAEYHGDVFFADYVHRWIKRLKFNSSDQLQSVENFATDAGAIVDFAISPAGELHYLDWDANTVVRLRYTGPARPPVAKLEATPRYGAAPLDVTFKGSESSDPDGTPVTFDWDFGDGSEHSSDPDPVHRYEDGTQNYTATLTVTDASGATDTKTVEIQPGNTPPSVSLEEPPTWRAGDHLTVEGSATDPEDGDLPDTALSWQVELIHIDHSHPSVYSGSGPEVNFEAANDHDADSHYKVTLTATDSRGLTTVETVDALPETSGLTIDSEPQGAPISYAGGDFTAPLSKNSTIGFVTSVSAGSGFVHDDRWWEFDSWSDGGARLHDITIPATGLALTATYKEAVPPDKLIEAEDMTMPDNYTLFEDPAASGGKSIRLARARALTEDVSTARYRRIVVRAKGDQCEGPPRMVVRLDGAEVMSVDVPSTNWADHEVDVPVHAGAHALRVEFVNDRLVSGVCDRNLHVDKLTFARGVGPPPPGPPAAPGGLAATAGDEEVQLDWDDSSESDLDGYDLYRSESAGGPYTRVNSARLASSEHSDAGLTNATTYYYVVTAVDLDGNESGDSSEASATPEASAAPGYSEVVLDTDGLLSYWRLGEASGTNAADSKGTNNGTYVGGPALAQGGALPGDTHTAAGFDGVNDHATFPGATLAFTTQATIEGFFRWQAGTVLFRDSTSSGGWILAYDNAGNIGYRAGGTNFTTTRPTASLRDGAWHHVALTVAGGTATLYVDGAVVRSATGAGTARAALPWRVMRNGTLSAFTQGRADELALYDRALSAATIAAHFAARGAPGPPPAAPTGLVATAGDGSVALDWADSPAAGLDGYNVYRSPSAGGPYTKANSALLAGSSFNDGGRTNGTTYHYVVRAVNTGGAESADSSEASATPVGAAATPGYRDVVLGTSGLLSYWRLGEAGGTTAADLKGTNNGSYLGGALLGQAGALTADSNTAAGFDGANDQVTFPGTALALSTAGTLEGLFRWQAGGTLLRDHTSAGGWILLFDNGGNLAYRVGGVTFTTMRPTTTVRNSAWHHLAVTVSGGTAALYIDGALARSASGAGTKAALLPWHLMRNGTLSGFSQGRADEIAVYNRALTAAEVQQHHAAR